MSDARFQAYIAPAQGDHWGRVLAGILLIALGWVGGTIAATGIYAAVAAMMQGDTQAGTAALDTLVAGGSPVGIMVLLASFLGIWGGVWLVLSGLHGRPFRTVMGPHREKSGIGGFWRGVMLGVGFAALSVSLTSALVGAPVKVMSFADWAPYALPIAVLVFFQATGEELIFRGYLLQQLAVRYRSPLIWGVLPSFIFGLMHFTGGLPGGGDYFYVAVTAITGAALAVTVWRTGALWAAAGIHVGINCTAILFFGTEGILSGSQIWMFPKSELGEIFLIDLGCAAVLLAFVLSPAGRWLAPRG
ncbi:MAG: type II CAAX endopeptidase family protein [Pseudomonadota bacterium]